MQSNTYKIKTIAVLLAILECEIREASNIICV